MLPRTIDEKFAAEGNAINPLSFSLRIYKLMNDQKSWFLMAGDAEQIRMEHAEIRFPIELPKKFIREHTMPGAVIFDPFAGFGTTLLAAQEMGRTGIGIEYERERAEFIQSRITPPSQIICGDSRRLRDYNLPAFDLCFTSPPFMRDFDKEDPLSNYHDAGDYQHYLGQLHEIFAQTDKLMKPDAYVLVEAENTFEKAKPMTPLAWDIARTLSDIFLLERELICCHTGGELESANVEHSYVFVFRKNR